MSPSMRVSDLPQPTFQKEVPNPGAAGEARVPDMPDRETGPQAAPRALPSPILPDSRPSSSPSQPLGFRKPPRTESQARRKAAEVETAREERELSNPAEEKNLE